MIRVGVCDDERILAQRLRRQLLEIMKERGAEVRISVFLSGKELLNEAENLDLVFLDLAMPDLDGVQTAKRLRLQNECCRIIMVSGMDGRIKDGFRAGAERFVTKPVDREELKEAVEAAFALRPGSRRILLYQGGEAFEFPERRIDYLEANDGCTLFCIGGAMYRREESLKFFCGEMDERLFIRISRKHLVNLTKIRGGNLADRMVVGSSDLTVSRRYQKEVRRRFLEYDGGGVL